MARRRATKPAQGRETSRSANQRKLHVMLSSRVNDPLPSAKGGNLRLSDVRKRIRAVLEDAELLGWKPFEVWINEDQPAQQLDRDAWDHCMDEVSRADVVVALVNGNAGWSVDPDGVGICHAELQRAAAHAPAKVRIVRIAGREPQGDKDLRFASWLETQKVWVAHAKNDDEAVAMARDAALDALGGFAAAGSREVRRGSWHSGDALAWSRLTFADRRDAMIRVVTAAVDGCTGSGSGSRETGLFASLLGERILLCPGAVPGPMTVAAARELLGQPFLFDHRHQALLDGAAGPVHVVACHRGVTESQASRILGFPDATLVTTPFGVWVADDVQKIQLLFLANCRDETSTRIAAQRAFEWLDSSGEAELLVRRAEQRARIVRAIAAENQLPDGARARRRRPRGT